MKPLTVDMPYPKITTIEKNERVAALIYPLYSGGAGEINAVLQYVYHGFYFCKSGEEKIREIIKSIAMAEMFHLEMLGELLVRLGANPAYFDVKKAEYYSAGNVSFTHTKKRMILDDIASELKAVKEYTDVMCAVGDSDVSALLARIRMDEDLHVLALKDVLEQL